MNIITRKGWLNSIAQTNEHPQFGTAYVLVKNYDDWGADTTNLEIVVRRPDGGQKLIYVFANSAGWPYEPGVPVVVLNADARYPQHDQIDGKPGPSSCGWRCNGYLEVSANLRCTKDEQERQAWVRVVLREVAGVWREV
jgi:hypothetical protein